MKQMFEILIPLTLIIVLLMCMMNNTNEDSFSVGRQCNRRIEEGFTPGDWDKSSDSNQVILNQVILNLIVEKINVKYLWYGLIGVDFLKKPNLNGIV